MPTPTWGRARGPHVDQAAASAAGSPGTCRSWSEGPRGHARAAGRTSPRSSLLRSMGHLLSHLAVQTTGNGCAEGAAGLIAFRFREVPQDSS